MIDSKLNLFAIIALTLSDLIGTIILSRSSNIWLCPYHVKITAEQKKNAVPDDVFVVNCFLPTVLSLEIVLQTYVTNFRLRADWGHPNIFI